MEKRACLISCSVEGKIKDDCKLVDRISELPDEILVKIVSLLPLKEAGATSTLSRRWLYVWTLSDKLNFDADETLRRYEFQYHRKFKDQESSKYVDWVNHVVEQHGEQGDLVQFRVCFFGLDKRFTSSINKWIQFAMKKRVQVLVLDCVSALCGVVCGREKYTITNDLKSSPEYLSFKSLKVLHLDSVNMTGDVLERMLRNCPHLEKVSVYYVSDLVELSAVGPTIALKYLEIKYCWDIKRIQIRDANLVSLSYNGDTIELDLKNVPLLIELSVCYREFTEESITLAFAQFSCCINQLQILMLDIPAFSQANHVKIPVLPNLKNFKARVCADACVAIPMLAAFMKAFPNLQKLVLMLECSPLILREGENELLRELECSSPFTREGEQWLKRRGYIIEAEKCPHHCIKVVEVLGYRKLSSALELVSYTVKNAVALDKLVIDPVRHREFHATRANRTTEEIRTEEIRLEEKARDHAMRFIKKELPSSVEFVCL